MVVLVLVSILAGLSAKSCHLLCAWHGLPMRCAPNCALKKVLSVRCNFFTISSPLVCIILAEHASSCVNHTQKDIMQECNLPVLTELLTSLLCEWPFSGKKETFDGVSKVSESLWYAFVISEMTLILAWHVISDAGYFLTKRVQNNMLSRFDLELLRLLPCCCIAKQLLMLIEFCRNIFRSYWKLGKKEKSGHGTRHGQNYVTYREESFKTWLFNLLHEE